MCRCYVKGGGVLDAVLSVKGGESSVARAVGAVELRPWSSPKVLALECTVKGTALVGLTVSS